LDKINSSLKKVEYATENMTEAIKIQVGTMEIEAYYTPGHTGNIYIRIQSSTF